MASLRVTAVSDDEFVRVTVGAEGDLRGLELDPRLGRWPEPGGLADKILHTVGEAADRALTQAAEVARPLVPGSRRDKPVDVRFGPALAEFDRLIALPPPVPRADGRPEVEQPDLRGIRDRITRQRDFLRTASATASSSDGLVTATVNGRGRLVGLRLDRRVFERSNSRWLAGVILATAQRAADDVRESWRRHAGS